MRPPADRPIPRSVALLALLLAATALVLGPGTGPAGAEEGRDRPDRCSSDDDDDRCTTTTTKPTTTTTEKPTTTTTEKPTTTTTAKPTTTTEEPTTTTEHRRRRPPTPTTEPPTTAGFPAPAPTDPPPPPTPGPAPAPSPTPTAGSSSAAGRTAQVGGAGSSRPPYVAPAATEPNPFLEALAAVGGILPRDEVRAIPGGSTDPVDELRTSLAAARLEDGGGSGVPPAVWAVAGVLGLAVLAAVLRLDRRLARS